jgi:hypothetical protein
MKLSEALEIQTIIERGTSELKLRRAGIEARSILSPIKKLAFDTRRINQETERNPRGNLQYYSRSEPFVDDKLAEKIGQYMKIKTAVDLLKERYGREPEWFNSYARILSAAVDRALRIEQKDGDFYKAQFDYLDELLYVRYRLSDHDLCKMGEMDLERTILGKDEKLLHKQVYGIQKKETRPSEETYSQKREVVKDGQEPLIERLMGDVRASEDKPDIERSITITVRDKINDMHKNG